MKKLLLHAIGLMTILPFLVGCTNTSDINQPNEPTVSVTVKPTELLEIIDNLYFDEILVFDIDDYKDSLENWTPDIVAGKTYVYGETTTIQQAAINAEDIFTDVFEQFEAEHEKPYKVYYDDHSKAWLVTGSFYKTMKSKSLEEDEIVGGVINVIIDEKSGKVLAVWGEE